MILLKKKLILILKNGYYNLTKPNFKKNGKWEYSILIDELITNFCKIYGLNFNEIPLYKKTIYRLYNGMKLTNKHKKYYNIFTNSKMLFNKFLNTKTSRYDTKK